MNKLEQDLNKSNLRRSQLRMLDMLLELDKVCRKHNIPYWMEFGTLLGAVRHKGFIPWDDDIDVCVMNDDYTTLRRYLQEELPEQFTFQDTTTDKYAFFHYGRIRDKKSYCYYPHFVKLKEQGLWLDIFRMDKVHSVKAKQIVDFFYRRAYHEIHHFGDVAYSSKITIFFNKMVAYLIYPICSFAVSLLRFIGKRCNQPYLARFTMSDNSLLAYDDIFPLTELEFEGHKFFAPKKWDTNLREIYGDYMQIPPENQREQILDMSKVKFYD